MEEFVDLLDENGRHTGKTISKNEAHEKGLWHRVTVIGVVDKDKNILMQKRGHDKRQFPNTWDISASGHVSAGETSLISGVRELSEEVGITANKEDLIFITSFRDSITHPSGVIENEYFDVFLYKVDKLGKLDLKMQVEELDDMEIMKLDDVIELAAHDELAAKSEAYFRIKEYLEGEK